MVLTHFGRIGSRGYFFFLLFQCFINRKFGYFCCGFVVDTGMITADVDGKDDRRHSNESLVIGGNGPYIPFPSHSFLASMGPKTWMLLLDCRCVKTLWWSPWHAIYLADGGW